MTFKTFRKRALLVTVALIAASFVAIPAGPVAALQGAEFNAGYIVSDSVSANVTSMSAAQIQSFLTARESSCKTSSAVPCLMNYSTKTTSRSASTGGQCASYAGVDSESASQIIAKVASACGVNPQVLLVILEKEQGLVSSSAPSSNSYRSATGYGCPDSGSCDAAYYGLYNQLYMAAWQLREFILHPNSWHYRVGSFAIPYNQDPTCDAPVVNIVNLATAALYNYTPYQPNAAALANLSGSGDGCSAYGNRNFWVYFSNWFGSPTGYDDPVGSVDVASVGIAGIHLAGWALDPNSNASIQVHAYVNGIGTPVVANLARADLAAPFGASNTLHGFDLQVAITPALLQHVCVYAINIAAGINTAFPCFDLSGSPVGALDSVTAANGTITAAGWAIDPESAAPVSVDMYVDAGGARYSADRARGDLAKAFPDYGASHGYTTTSSPSSAGQHEICVYAINVQSGSNSLTGCKQVMVPDAVPIGTLDVVSLVGGRLVASGWSVDPNIPDPITVHVYVDGIGTAITANLSRPDVGAALHNYGDLHGFTASAVTSPGRHEVCAYGIDSSSSGSGVLGCTSVVVLTGPVIGSVDAVRASAGQVSVAGWALDPDTSLSTNIRVQVDATSTVVPAASARADIGAAFPVYGAGHGFSASIAVAAGAHRVCIFGQKISDGGEVSLGCSVVNN